MENSGKRVEVAVSSTFHLSQPTSRNHHHIRISRALSPKVQLRHLPHENSSTYIIVDGLKYGHAPLLLSYPPLPSLEPASTTGLHAPKRLRTKRISTHLPVHKVHCLIATSFQQGTSSSHIFTMDSLRKRRHDEQAGPIEAPSALGRLRNMWQFASLCQWFYIFGGVVKMDNLDIDVCFLALLMTVEKSSTNCHEY